MKIVLIFDKPYDSTKRLLPRDIRNYLGSISKSNDDLNKIVMWHEMAQPTFIYSMPNPKSAAIYTFKEDLMTQLATESLIDLIKSNPDLYINGQKLTIKEVFIADYGFTQFKQGLYERRLRTPMIIAVSKTQYTRARNLSANNKVDMPKLEELVKEVIIDMATKHSLEWANKEIDLSNIIIKFKNLEYTPIRFKETEHEYFPAIRGTIISNIELPQFIGYKCGMGYGELSTLKEMDRRKNPNNKAS